jgi:phage-related minor tail protein
MPVEIDTVTVRVEPDTKPFEKKLLELSRQTNAFSGTVSRALKDAILGGQELKGVLNSLALRLSGMAFDRALQPIGNIPGSGIGSVFGAFGLAKGDVVGGNGLRAFARGGVVGGPTLFPLGNGLGLMGEAGAEAVLPLARGRDGRLGVRSDAGAPVSVVFNITTADADSFRKSEAQVSAMLARAVGRGRRGL